MEAPCRPCVFYLPSPSLEALADCSATVGGVRLPLHSQVLAVQSSVLRELLLAQLEGGAAAQGPPDLSAAFEGSTAAEAACLLRFMYRPQEATPAAFAALAAAGRLPGVAALAHKLDIPRPLAAIETYLEGAACYSETGAAGLLIALQLAQGCRFEGVEARCLDALAAKLAAAAAHPGEQPRCQAMWEAVLAATDPPTLARLLRRTLAACGAPPPEGWEPEGWAAPGGPVSPAASSTSASSSGTAVGGAGEEHAEHAAAAAAAVHDVRQGCGGGFTVQLDNFPLLLQQRPGQPVCSPWVRIGGMDWRLVVHPRGVPGSADEGAHMSAFIELDRGSSPAAATAAGVISCSLRALAPPAGGGAAGDVHAALDRPQPFGPGTPSSWGWELFLPLTDVGRLLHGDGLLLRADVAIGLDP